MKNILFFGDSITDTFRDREADLTEEAALGTGYVKHLHARLLSENFDNDFFFINKGISGNITTQLLDRLEEDVLSYDVDTVFMMIGINDVWQRFEPTRAEHWVFEEDYQNNLDQLILKIKASGKDLVLLSPFFLELDKEDKMRKLTDKYRTILQDCAKKHGLDYINIQKNMDAYLEKHAVNTISQDRVHVNHIGNALIANPIYDYFKMKGY